MKHIILGSVKITDSALIYPNNPERRCLYVNVQKAQYGSSVAKTDYVIFLTLEQIETLHEQISAVVTH